MQEYREDFESKDVLSNQEPPTFRDPTYTRSIFVCGLLHHSVFPVFFGGRRSFQIRYATHF